MRFTRAYYARYYDDEVSNRYFVAHTQACVSFIIAACQMLDIRIRTVADVGAGTDMWKRELTNRSIRYSGYDVSPYACRTFGWKRLAIERGVPPRADLVICNSVLSYLDDTSAIRAMHNLRAAARKVLFISVATKHDYDTIICSERSDTNVYQRNRDFYTTSLEQGFWHFGGGLFVRKTAKQYAFDLWRKPS